MIITDAALRTQKSLPALNAENVKVKQGKSLLSVVQVIPCTGRQAALQLMIVIDDTLNTQAVGNDLNDLKAFKGAPIDPRSRGGRPNKMRLTLLYGWKEGNRNLLLALTGKSRLPKLSFSN